MSKEPKFTIKIATLPQDKYPIKAAYQMVPEGITIHETDNGATAEQEIAYMQRNDKYVSFHYAVDNKNIIQGAPLDRNTFHAGDGATGRGNRKTISIEICGNYRRDEAGFGTPQPWYKEARANAEELAGWLMFVYGWGEKDIYTHNNWSGKNCPRVILKEGYLNTFKKNALKHRDSYKNLVAPAPTPSTGSVKIGDTVRIKSSAKKYANVSVNIPAWVKNMAHTVMDVAPDRVRLKEINSWVLLSDIEGYKAPSTPTPTPASLKVGDMVVVKSGSRSYTNQKVAAAWYTTPKRIDQLNGKRAVLDIKGWCTAFNTDNLVKAGAVSKPAAPATKEYVQLLSNVSSWGWYPLGVQPVAKNIKGYLSPSKFGGLEYEILGKPFPFTITIQTKDYGKVNIWIGPGTGHRIVRK